MEKEEYLSKYPRPSLKRNSYLSLHGPWEYKILKDEELSSWDKVSFDGEIIVPYPLGSPYSQVDKILCPDEVLVYHRKIKFPNDFIKEDGHLFINFFGVDQIAILYLNGKFVGKHEGGYTPFSYDILPFVKPNEANDLYLYVKDYTDTSYYGRGKQALKPHGIWYHPFSGIYLPTFIEATPKAYLKNIKVTPLFDEGKIDIYLDADEKKEQAKLYLEGNEISLDVNKHQQYQLKEIHPWSIDDPYLYDIKIKYGEDEIESYFGFRKIEIKVDERNIKRFYLNNSPIFINGLLDQGYFANNSITPLKEEEYLRDIKLAKELGYNTLRKHLKIENPLFYYYCDKEGMLLIQDFVNGGGKYSFFITVFSGFFGWHYKDNNYSLFKRENLLGRELFKKSVIEILSHLYNHPSIILYTIFNEGWGQFDSKDIYELCMKNDSSRLYDVNSGWHDQRVGKIKSIHKYFVKYHEKPDKYQRLKFLSEFGGYSFNAKIGQGKYKMFGYKFYHSQEKLMNAISSLYYQQIIPSIPLGLSGAIYTELSDVEGEVNGLVTTSREQVKVDRAKMKKINQDLQLEFAKSVRNEEK